MPFFSHFVHPDFEKYFASYIPVRKSVFFQPPIENFFRKSVVKNAVFNRDNTKTNTPAIIYTKIIKGNEINIKVLIKGAGSENKSKLGANALLGVSKERICDNIKLIRI